MGLAIRYSMIESSLNQLRSVPDALLNAMLSERLWAPEQALTFARRERSETERPIKMAIVSAHLPDKQRLEILSESLQLTRALQLPSDERNFEDRPRDDPRADVVERLVPYLCGESLVTAADPVQRRLLRAGLEPGIIVARMDEAHRERLLERVFQCDDDYQQTTRVFLNALAPYNPSRRLVKALNDAQWDRYDPWRTLAAALPFLNATARSARWACFSARSARLRCGSRKRSTP